MEIIDHVFRIQEQMLYREVSMARKHGGLGRGLDALIPMRSEVEEAMKISNTADVEVLFSDEEEGESQNQNQADFIEKKINEQNHNVDKNVSLEEEPANVSRETLAKHDSRIEDTSHTEEARTVRISEVEPNRNQPRKYFDEEKLEELADSISKYGLLQPILVQDCGDHYEIIAGERRWRASLKAGLKEVPVIIRKYTDKEILELSLIENLQREDLNPIEEAKAYKQLMEEFGLKQEEVAEQVSKSRSAVTNSMRLLKLDEEVQQMVIDGRLSMGHARALVSIEDRQEQKNLAHRIEEEKLSVRDTEREVKNIQQKLSEAESEKLTANQKKKTGSASSEDASLSLIYREIEERLRQSLNTRVVISHKKNGSGKVQIEFYNNEDLERIIDRLTSL